MLLKWTLAFLLTLTIAFGTVSQSLAFAADDDNKRDVKTLEERCAKKKPTGFDGLVCNAVLGLQNQVDSFFDVFVTIDTFNQSMQSLEDKILKLLMQLQQNQQEEILRVEEEIGKESSDRQAADTALQGQIDSQQSTIDSFFDIFTELQTTDTNLQNQIDLLENQRCPPGQVVVGIENSVIVCEPIPQTPPPPPPPGLPIITSFTPVSGPVGTLVTINGNNLSGITDVQFNGISITEPADVTSANSIKVLVPLGAMTGKISVTTSIGTAQSIANFNVSPRIDDFQPRTANSGDTVTITGFNFAGGTTTVKFNGVTATNILVTANEIRVIVPTSTTVSLTGPITVQVGTLTGASSDVFKLKPKINTISPTSGPVGTSVTLTGINLDDVIEIRFNGTPATDVIVVTNGAVTDTVRVTVPNGATTGSLTAVSPGGTSLPSVTVFKVTPKIDSFSPVSGSAGTQITITGTNLVSTAGTPLVRFLSASNVATSASVVAATPTSVIVTVPNLAAGDYRLQIQTVDNAPSFFTTITTFTVTSGP